MPALLLRGVYRCGETAESVVSPFELILLVADDLSITENAAPVQFSTLAIEVVVRDITGGEELWVILQTFVDPLIGESDKGKIFAF